MQWQNADSIAGGVSIPEQWVYLMYYEAFNLLFRIENALRVFVYVVLKNELRDKWVEAQVIASDEEGTLTSLSKKRMSQAQTFGYLGYAITCPVMHLNSGELTRLIVSDTYWKLFKPFFLGGKEIIKSKLDEIGSIRNALAHFRPIRADDVAVLKQNSKHVLLGIEKFLGQVLLQSDVVPTNTPDTWYTALKTIGTDQCSLTFQQSEDEQWVQISMKYACPIIKEVLPSPNFIWVTVLTLRTSSILREYPEITKHICYLSESSEYPRMIENQKAELGKTFSFVLSRSMLASKYSVLKESLEDLLLTIAKETELIKKDNLARGKLIHSTGVSASFKNEDKHGFWSWHYPSLSTPVMVDDPPEYWGDFTSYSREDFIAGTNQYPWMPETVSSTGIF